MKSEDLNIYLFEVKEKVDATPKNAPSQRKLIKQKYTFSDKSLSEQLIIMYNQLRLYSI